MLVARAPAAGWRALAYAIDYRLDLFSNFTYAIDRENGDQFEQFDDRARLRRRVRTGDWHASLGALPGVLRAGIELRHDDIDPVGLYRTTARERFDTVREDPVEQTQLLRLCVSVTITLERLAAERRSALRADYFDFDVDSDLAANCGDASDSIVSSEAFRSCWARGRRPNSSSTPGAGFHSNDARGTTIPVDPADGVTPVERGRSAGRRAPVPRSACGRRLCRTCSSRSPPGR